MNRRAWLLLAALVLAAGCGVEEKPLPRVTPTASEQSILRAFRLDPDSVEGQKKIHALRRTRERITVARERTEQWQQYAQQQQDRASRRRQADSQPGVEVVGSYAVFPRIGPRSP